MAHHAWLTPESAPVGMVRFCIYVPNADVFIWNLQGILAEWAEEASYANEGGGISEADAAAAWEDANLLNLPLVECPEE